MFPAATRHWPVGGTLSTMALGGSDRFMRHTSALTSPHDDARRYVLNVNEDRTTAEVLEILGAMLDSALRPDPGYRLPVPTLLLVGHRRPHR